MMRPVSTNKTLLELARVWFGRFRMHAALGYLYLPDGLGAARLSSWQMLRIMDR
jgi:hypothetical protein